MAFKLKNKASVADYILKQGNVIEKALIYRLEYTVAQLENHAKLNGEYQDRTANLRSSIGGVVLKDGKPVTFRGFEGTSDGVKTGMEFINSLISKFQSGYVVLIVAGMEYATYVEDMYGLNVLKKTELQMRQEVDRIIKDLKVGFNK